MAAYFASKFAIRKFKEEKVWDERRESYKEVIEAFEELIHWAEQVRASHCCEPTIEGESVFYQPLRKISKFSATGGLIFSKEFHSIVKETNTKVSKIRFKIDEESQPDMNTDKDRAEWSFILAGEIREVIESNLPKLIEVATNEMPKIHNKGLNLTN